MTNGPENYLPDVATAYAGVDVQELLTVTSRLTALLYEEVRLLDTMQIGEAGALQHEKEALTKVLEAQKKYIETQPEVMDEISDEERTELKGVVDAFDEALQQNVRLVAVAKAVNQRVVQAVLDTLAEQNSSGAYTKSGVATNAPKQGISITLNQQI